MPWPLRRPRGRPWRGRPTRPRAGYSRCRPPPPHPRRRPCSPRAIAPWRSPLPVLAGWYPFVAYPRNLRSRSSSRPYRILREYTWLRDLAATVPPHGAPVTQITDFGAQNRNLYVHGTEPRLGTAVVCGEARR